MTNKRRRERDRMCTRSLIIHFCTSPRHGEDEEASGRADEISIVVILGKNYEARVAVAHREPRVINRTESDTHL